MKPFGIWLALAMALFISLGGAYHYYLTRNPRMILVAVDTSYPMREVWHQVPEILESINRRRYARFSLITDKSRVHTWSSQLQAINVTTPYAPRNLSGISGNATFNELQEADLRILVTNAHPSEIKDTDNWEIVRPKP